MVVGSDKLASFDDLFGITSESDSEKSSQMISVDKIIPSCRNPFKVEENSEMDQLVASIRENGILMPLILRASDDSDTYDPVSYTHLDVYKRQVPHHPDQGRQGDL